MRRVGVSYKDCVSVLVYVNEIFDRTQVRNIEKAVCGRFYTSVTKLSRPVLSLTTSAGV